MTTLYIWGNHDWTGHTSLSFSGGYVSWHPRTKKQYLLQDTPPVPGAFFDPDYDNQNHPEGAFPINLEKTLNLDLDQQAMSQKFEELESSLKTYWLFQNNCSRVVAEIIAAGHPSGWHFYTHTLLFLKTLKDHKDQHGRIPINMPEIAQDVGMKYGMRVAAREAVALAKANKLTKFLLAAPGLSKVLCWTPHDVLEMVYHLDD